jgi:hypothetical protein
MDLTFKYETYQDVRRNLFLYSIPTLVVVGFFAFFCVLPSAHRQSVIALFEAIATSPVWKGILGAGAGLTVFVILAFLVTEILQVHDQWYDKYVIRWRHQYATDFILPRLIQPFASRTNYRFYEQAEIYTGQFQERLYYPFVGDRDPKIPKNKLLRFYEVVTVYWLTQINEVVLLGVALLVVIYRFTGPTDVEYRTLLLNDGVVITFFVIMNRLWIKSSLKKVRHGTEEEIRAIHEDSELRKDLEQRLCQLCRDYSIPYGQAEN